MSKYIALALAALVVAMAATDVVVAADQLRTQTQAKTCQGDCDCVCPNPDCPNPDCPQYEYQYQNQTGYSYQNEGPDDGWGAFFHYFFNFGGPWWD